jgi:hypothetical protein
MNCVDLQRSLAGVEDLSTAEEQAHLKTCAACSTLVAELELIASSASELRATDEPNPRVWNSIATALRQEGLIRPQAIRTETKRPFVVSNSGTSKSGPARGVPSRDIAASAAASRSFSSFAAGWGWRGWIRCQPALSSASTGPAHRPCISHRSCCRECKTGCSKSGWPQRRRLAAGDPESKSCDAGAVCGQSPQRQRLHPGCAERGRRQPERRRIPPFTVGSLSTESDAF